MPLFSNNEITLKIEKLYGVRAVECGLSNYSYGHNPDVDAGGAEQIWHYGGIEVLPSTNAIDTISSTNAGDTEILYVRGKIYNADGDFEDVIQTPTLNGQNKVVLSTPLARVLQFYNNNGTALLGNVYIYEDDTIVAGVPQTAANVHGLITIGDEQGANSLYSVDGDKYTALTQLIVSVGTQTNASVEFLLQVRNKDKVWRTVFNTSVPTTGGSFEFDLTIPYIIVPNSDVRILALTSGNNVTAYATAAYKCFQVI